MYTALKHLHVACVVLSLTGFVLRFALTMRGSPLVERRFVRTAPHVIDTVLLAAAISPSNAIPRLWMARSRIIC